MSELPAPVLFLFPHPDDDVFVGGTLRMLVRAGVAVDAAWVTSGDYDGLGELREAEMTRAMDRVGLPPSNRHLLRLPDGRLIAALDRLCEAVDGLVAEIAPASVVSPAFEGGHADHDAVGFAAAQACLTRGVPLFEYPCYAPQGPEGLRLNQFAASDGDVFALDIDAEALACKQAMVAAYVSQASVFTLLGWSPSKTTEPMRRARVDRDFTTAPCAQHDSYAHWFNPRSPDRFADLRAQIESRLLERQRT